MRMRKKKHAQSRLAACAGRVIAGAPEYSSEDRVFLEIGAGKGGFACETARRNPAVRYFAMERVTDCVVLAAERAEATQKESGGLEGLRFLIGTADDLALLFAPASVERIYLNFSDPWSKKGYAKRRLTHRRYLALYLALLRDGGRLAFKTDNVDLFDFTLGELAAIGWEPSFVTRDLHASPAAADNVMTEYETAFVAQGMKICMLTCEKPEGFSVPVPEELTPEGRRAEHAAREARASAKNGAKRGKTEE